MGKLGGREIGYGSDLDIFFVYEAAEDQDDLAEKYVRAAQRVLSPREHAARRRARATSSTRACVRPAARACSSSASTRSRATTTRESEAAEAWERQALLSRPRPCAGDAELGAQVIALAAKVAYERGAPDARAMHHLRMRMEQELARERRRGRYDVKLGRGGLVDVEFAVQWLQMKHGTDPRRPDDRHRDRDRRARGVRLPRRLASAPSFARGTRFLRRLEQALRVVHGTSASLIEEGAPGLPALARRMGIRDGANSRPERQPRPWSSVIVP